MLSSRRDAPPSRHRSSLHQRPNPPLSVPASARQIPPEDLLSRLEMEEWRNQTGIDDLYSLSLRPATTSFATAGSVPNNATGDFDRAGLAGLGNEERRGIKDRWGNTWGLESHILSPLSEHTEFTTVDSILSLSTRKSNHSLRSLDSTSNSIAQRLEQTDSNPMRLLKLGNSLIPSGVMTHVSNRSVSCPVNRIDSSTKLPSLNTKAENNKESSSCSSQQLLLEEKLKKKEQRRLKKEKIEKRRAQEILSSENLAQKQGRRRQEKKKKEEFLAKKHQILTRLQESGHDAKLVRDLGILYMTSNLGVAGLQLAIRHLETSLQMDDSDALAWSCLGKTWSYLYDVPEVEITNKASSHNHLNFPQVNKAQQAHNATIGLRKAIINSKTYDEVINYKIHWARFLEKINRWRDSLGLISELLKNFGKSDFKSWANLGFIGLRIIFGWSPLQNLEADDLEQGFIPKDQNKDDHDSNLIHLFKNQESLVDNLSDSDRFKLLTQVHDAFERAITIIDEQIISNHLTQVHNDNNQNNNYNNTLVHLDCVDHLKTLKSHYFFQLNQLEIIRKHVDLRYQPHQQQQEEDISNASPSPKLIRDHAPHQSLNSTRGDQVQHPDPLDPNTHTVQDSSGLIDHSIEKQPSVLPSGISAVVGTDSTPPVSIKDEGDGEDRVTQEIHECSSPGNHSDSSTPSHSTVPIFDDSFNLQSNLKKESQDQPLCNASHDLTPPTVAIKQADHPLSSCTPEKTRTPSTPLASSTANRQQHEGNSHELLHLQSTKELKSLTTDGDAPSSDGPEVIVQYDDVDTTNDYSENSQFSDDPFRSNPPLGSSRHYHQFDAHPLVTTDHNLNRTCDQSKPDSVVNPSLSNLKFPIQDLESSLPSQQSDPLSYDHHDHHENQSKLQQESTVENDLPPSSPTLDLSLPSSSSPHPQINANLLGDNVDNSVASPKHSPSVSRSIPRDNESVIIKKSSRTLGQNSVINNETGPPNQNLEEKNRDKNNLTPTDKLFDSDISCLHLHRKISKLGLTSPAQRKLKGLDKETLIAFLELDNEYHSKISKLRQNLIKIEKEREINRKKMFEELGIQQIYYRDDDLEQDSQTGQNSSDEEENDDIEDEEGRNVIRKGLGLVEESNLEGRVSTVERKIDQPQTLGSSFSSTRSGSSIFTRPKLEHHRPQNPQPMSITTQDSNKKIIMGISRSVCSPIQRNNQHKIHGLREGRRPFSLHDHPGVYEPLDPHSHSHNNNNNNNHNNNVSCTSNSTIVNDSNNIISSHRLSSASETLAPNPIPGSSDSNQANIALQGIAAILKLATSTQSN